MVWIALFFAVVAIGGTVTSWARFARANAQSVKALAQLRSENKALNERIAGLTRLANENRRGVQDAKDRAADARSEVESERGRLIETRALVEQVRLAQNHKVAREHGNTALVLREARRNTRGPTVKRLLLLVTIHRSASTTLFDILRGHPDVFFEPTAKLWQDAGLRGRRYPLDLSNGPTADLAIEVEPGVGALIPLASGQVRNPSIAIEKAHPQFFDFDANTFADHLEQLERDAPYGIDLVYGIRNPVDAMWSMIEYQQRNSLWYQFLKPEAVPDFIERSLVEIEALHRRIPGPILDYSDITQAAKPLQEAFMALGDTPVTADLFHEACEAFTAESRSKLQRGRFVGEGSGERDPGGPAGAWANASDTIENATHVYERLRAQHHD